MEIWDVLDINRNKIEGRVSVRGSDDMSDDEFHLVVFAAVADRNNNLAVSMRDRNKMFGGSWEFTGGSALSGESSRQAAEREVLEEMGIDISKAKGKIVADAVKYWKGSNWFYDVWVFRCDIDKELLKPQPGEVEKIELFHIDKICQMVENDEFTSITKEFIEDIRKALLEN